MTTTTIAAPTQATRLPDRGDSALLESYLGPFKNNLLFWHLFFKQNHANSASELKFELFSERRLNYDLRFLRRLLFLPGAALGGRAAAALGCCSRSSRM